MGEDILNCMVRDPRWIYCYWELAPDALARASRGRSPRVLDTVRWVLRVSPLVHGGKGGEFYDIEIDAEARSWYVKVAPGTRYRVELGLVTVGGDFVPLVSGVEAETPPEPLGEIASRDWGPLSSELERLVEQGLVGSSASSFTSTPAASTSATSTSAASVSRAPLTPE